MTLPRAARRVEDPRLRELHRLDVPSLGNDPVGGLAGRIIALGLREGAARVNDLIDTTEMYLRTIFELEEEGVTPLRARIAERLHQSGPTVSQTVARMERDGLVTVEGDRHLELSDTGRKLATQVMRKHRLAERLLIDVIGLDWEDVHIEACRWEHVMSEAVERRLVALLDNPTTCPHGNPIPGLRELGLPELGLTEHPATGTAVTGLQLMSDVATDHGVTVTIQRISEQIQPDAKLLHQLTDANVRPGNSVVVTRRSDGVDVDGHLLPQLAAEHIFVSRSR